MISLEKVFKEILPIYSRYMTMNISELPTEVITNIQSYLLGRPGDLRIKYNKNLKAIQQKYKIEYDRPDIFSGHCRFPICMNYSIKSQNLKPHMINSKRNITRIVNFVNNFQYGYPNDDIDYHNKEEIERYNSFFKVDVENDDDINLEYPLTISIELTSFCRCHHTFEFGGEIYTKEFEKTYIFENFTKKGLKRAFELYILDISEFMTRHSNIKVKLRNFRIEVEIRPNIC